MANQQEESLNFGFAVRFRDGVTAGAKKAAESIGLLWRGYKDLIRTANTTALAIRRWQLILGKATRVAREAGGVFGSSARSLGAWTESAKRAVSGSSTLLKVVGLLSMGFGAGGLVATLRDVIKVGSEFEQQMVNIQSVMNLSSSELQGMTDFARKLGRDTHFSAKEVAEGMYILGQAGLKVDEVLKTIQPTMALATIGGISMERASETLISTLGQFKFTVDDSTRVVNTFAAAANAAQTDITRISHAMRQAGPVAAALGANFEDVTAAIGVFSGVGVHGEQAGVALRNIMAGMMQPSKHLTEALDYLHLKMTDVDLRTHSLGDVMNKLAPLANRVDLAFNLFGKRSAPQFLAFASTGTDSIKRMREEMAKQATAAAIMEMRMSTVGGAMKLLTSTMDEIKLVLYDFIKPALLRRLQQLNYFWLDVAATISALQPVFEVFVTLIDDLFGMLGRTIARVFSGIVQRSHDIRAAAAAGKDALEQTLGPMVLWATIMAVRVKKFFGGFIEGAEEAWNTIRTISEPILGALSAIVQAVMELTGSVYKGNDIWRDMGRIVGRVVVFIAAFAAYRWMMGVPIKVLLSWGMWIAVALKSMAAAEGIKLFLTGFIEAWQNLAAVALFFLNILVKVTKAVLEFGARMGSHGVDYTARFGKAVGYLVAGLAVLGGAMYLTIIPLIAIARLGLYLVGIYEGYKKLKPFASAVWTAAKNLEIFKKASAGITTVMEPLRASIAATGRSMMAMLANPVFLVVAAITLMVVALILVIKYWDRITAWFAKFKRETVNTIAVIAILVFGVLAPFIAALGIFALIARNWDKISVYLRTTFAPTIARLKALWASFKNDIIDGLHALEAPFIEVWDNLKAIAHAELVLLSHIFHWALGGAGDSWVQFKAAAVFVLGVIWAAAKWVAAKILAAWVFFEKVGVTIWAKTGSGIIAVFQFIWDAIVFIFKVLWGVISWTAGAAVDVWVFFAESTWGIVSWVANKILDAFIWVFETIEGFIETNRQTFDAAATFIGNVWRIQMARARIAVAYFVLGAKALWVWLRDTVWPIIVELWDSLVLGARKAIMYVVGAFLYLYNSVVDFFTGISDTWDAVSAYIIKVPFLQPIVNVINTASRAIKGAFSELMRFLSSLKLPGWLTQILEWLAGETGNSAASLEARARVLEEQAFGPDDDKPAKSVGMSKPSAKKKSRMILPDFGGVGGGGRQSLSGTGAAPGVPETGSSIVDAAQPGKNKFEQYVNHFHAGAISMKSEITNVEDFARKLLPVLNRVGDEVQRRGKK